MLSSKLVKWAGAANIAAGLMTAVFWFIHPNPQLNDLAARTTGRWTFVYGMFVFVLILTLFALVGILAKQLDKAKALGIIGYILGSIGTAIFIGAGTFDGFVSPILAGNPLTQSLLDAKGPLLTHLSPLFILGGLCFALGYILLGISIMRAKVLPKYAGLLLILSGPILGLSPLMPAVARTYGSLVFGLTNVWIGYAMWTEKDQAAVTG
ncbi:hypothetical protein D4R52_00125 [bacterium]|nr:MAG: hypothetical protein D4R52_00125 [bacterium]